MGDTTEQEVYNDGKLRTTYESKIENTSDKYAKKLTVTGRSFVPASSTTPHNERTYQISLRGIPQGGFSVVAGVGGLVMENSSKVLGGNLLVNGRITMSGSSTIGTASTPLDEIIVANYSCPQAGGATYPKDCADMEYDNPITIENPAWIYGDVKANWQKTTSSMSNGGLVQSSGVAHYNYLFKGRWTDSTSPSTTFSGNKTCDSNGSSYAETWPANYKITGNVALSNKCKIKVMGNVWIQGKITMTQQSQLVVDDSLNTNPPDIMVDGIEGMRMSNSSQLVSNASGTGFRVITYWSNAGCSPGCTSVTGNDLYNSRNQSTIILEQTTQAPNTEFIAHWSKLEMNNSGGVGALAAQTVRLSNSAAVSFGASASGFSGISSWIVKDYRRSYTPL
jgi:hypothetical protein